MTLLEAFRCLQTRQEKNAPAAFLCPSRARGGGTLDE